MDNSPKTEKYPDIEYVLHIYDTIWDYLQTATVYYGKNVPLFRRNGYRKSGAMIP